MNQSTDGAGRVYLEEDFFFVEKKLSKQRFQELLIPTKFSSTNKADIKLKLQTLNSLV